MLPSALKGKECTIPESVVVPVVGGLELDIHQVDGGGGRADEEDLHSGVVDGDEVGKKVQIARHEHHQEEDLRLARDTRTGPGLPDLQDAGPSVSLTAGIKYSSAEL